MSLSQMEQGKTLGEGSRPIRLAGSTLGNRAHICAFFNSPEDVYRILLPFIKEGLELGEKAVHTVDPRRRDEHIRRLASAGIDVTAVHKNGQFELRDCTDTHVRGGQFDLRRHVKHALWRREFCSAEAQSLIQLGGSVQNSCNITLTLKDGIT
jgi:DcmR-like sensory protein